MKTFRLLPIAALAVLTLLLAAAPPTQPAPVRGARSGAHAVGGGPGRRVRGWLDWRGPQQNGTSLETGLPDTWVLGGTNDRWQIDLAGGGTPVIAGGKLYALGYQGQGPDLQEVLLCADAETGKRLWEHRFSDFLSDIPYDRYQSEARAWIPIPAMSTC